MNKSKQANVRAQFLAEGVLSASELATKLKVSQPTVSRLLQDFGPDLVRLGAGRTTRYALCREVEPGQSKWPLYRIDERGEAQELGWLHALHGGHSGLWWLEGAENWPSLKHGEFKDGIFEDLPWFLMDKRPQGYIGKYFARWAAIRNPFPDDPTKWNSDQILWSFLHHGDDLPGAFLVGDSSLKSLNDWRNNSHTTFAKGRVFEYAKLVERFHLDKSFGSSAGGEQPKFTFSYTDETLHEWHRAIVKFSPKIDSPNGSRWADLLRAEYEGILTLNRILNRTTQAEILSANNRVFLESVRFDRVSDWGRRAVVSLEAVDGAFLGMNGKPWPEAATELRRLGLISDEDVETIGLYWHFGELIGNNDMHYGNLSFFLHPEFPMTVCPPYDMLPMLYAPTRNGEIVPRSFQPRHALPRERDLRQRAAEAAVLYWEKLADIPQLSEAFRVIAAENAGKVRGLL